jgi:glucose-1-phosphate thymidylyltransferase
MSDLIREYVTTAFPRLPVRFVEQGELLGLGHAIYVARESITTDPVLIILGDTIFDVELHPVFRKPVTALGVRQVEDPRRFGVAVTSNGTITRLVEKPETPISNLAVVGLYYIVNAPLLRSCLEDVVRKGIRTKGEYQLTDVLQMMIERGEKMETFPVEGWYDCGKPETLLSTNRALLEKGSTYRALAGVVINEPVYIAPTAEIRNSIIGPNTTVGDGADVSDCIIRNSIIGGRAHVERVLLENTIVGNEADVAGSYKRLNVGDLSEIVST